MGTLAGGIAHDFNNILLAIQGHTELAGLKVPADSGALRHLREVLSATARATDLVRQILTFSRPRGEERRPLALAPVVKEAVRLLRASLPATVRISVAAPADLPPEDEDAVLEPGQRKSVAHLRSFAAIPEGARSEYRKEVDFQFFAVPERVIGNGKVEALEVAETEFRDGQLVVEPSALTTVEAVITAIEYSRARARRRGSSLFGTSGHGTGMGGASLGS